MCPGRRLPLNAHPRIPGNSGNKRRAFQSSGWYAEEENSLGNMQELTKAELNKVRERLLPGERILWQGKPRS